MVCTASLAAVFQTPVGKNMKITGIVLFVVGVVLVVLPNWPLIGGLVALGGIVVAIAGEDRQPTRQ
jgi:membrane-bound ClpP family serine protease